MVIAACASTPPSAPLPVPVGPPIDTVRIALTDLGARSYLGNTGGLYASGSNQPTAEHDAAGVARRNTIRPLDVNGIPSAAGKYVLISIGMSNTTQEWCSQSSAPPCNAWTLMGRAAADAEVNHGTLVIVNGAAGGQDADKWSTPTAANYDRIRDVRLGPLGLSEKQVQAAWVKLAVANPRVSLPSDTADARIFLRLLGDVARSLKIRYPNLQQIFLSSRTYAGYATTQLNPEPFAYEEGFSVKWLIDAQIVEARGAAPSAVAGTLSYATGAAPWLAWGPYLWANGTSARSDGVSWERSDFQNDGTHPSQSGESKIGAMLLGFFKTSPYTRCWFVAGQICG